jgi:DNA adenine methylase
MTPAKPPLRGWLGGKSKLAKKIVERIPEHTCYCEPFAGAAWVLFFKPPSKVEVLNDYSQEVTNFYRVVQEHLPEFIRRTKRLLVSRSEFKRLNRIPAETLTDIKRAVRFYYLLRCSFGGRMASPTFGTSATKPPQFNPLAIKKDLLAAHQRLGRVTIEHLSLSRRHQSL